MQYRRSSTKTRGSGWNPVCHLRDEVGYYSMMNIGSFDYFDWPKFGSINRLIWILGTLIISIYYIYNLKKWIFETGLYDWHNYKVGTTHNTTAYHFHGSKFIICPYCLSLFIYYCCNLLSLGGVSLLISSDFILFIIRNCFDNL